MYKPQYSMYTYINLPHKHREAAVKFLKVFSSTTTTSSPSHTGQ